MEEKILDLLRLTGPMKSGDVARAIEMPKADVDKAIKKLMARQQIYSPNRCLLRH